MAYDEGRVDTLFPRPTGDGLWSLLGMIRVPSTIAWSVVLAVAYGVPYYTLNRAAYYPSRFPEGFWELLPKLNAEDIWLRTADGVRMHAWWIPRAGTRLATLFSHGNAGNITDRFPHIRAIIEAGSALLIPDYRGYGNSEGQRNLRNWNEKCTQSCNLCGN